MAEKNPAWGKSNSPVGRVNREEYLIRSIFLWWYIFLFLFLGILTNGFVSVFFGDFVGISVFILSVLCACYLYWKYLMVCVKRWHDLNLSGWMCLATFACSILLFFYLIAFLTNRMELFITVAFIHDYAKWGFVLLSLIQLFVKGTKGQNKYGPNPLEQRMSDQNKIVFNKIPSYVVCALSGLVVGLPFILPRFFPWTEDYAGFEPYPPYPYVRKILILSHLALALVFICMLLFVLIRRKGKAYFIHYLKLLFRCLFSFILFCLICMICDYIA